MLASRLPIVVFCRAGIKLEAGTPAGPGAHKFYVGKVGMGILYIFTGAFLSLGLLVDLFTIPSQVQTHNAMYGRSAGINQQQNVVVNVPSAPQPAASAFAPVSQPAPASAVASPPPASQVSAEAVCPEKRILRLAGRIESQIVSLKDIGLQTDLDVRAAESAVAGELLSTGPLDFPWHGLLIPLAGLVFAAGLLLGLTRDPLFFLFCAGAAAAEVALRARFYRGARRRTGRGAAPAPAYSQRGKIVLDPGGGEAPSQPAGSGRPSGGRHSGARDGLQGRRRQPGLSSGRERLNRAVADEASGGQPTSTGSTTVIRTSDRMSLTRTPNVLT